VNVLVTPSFTDYLIGVMEAGIRMFQIDPDLNLAETILNVGHERMSEELRNCGRAVYDRRLEKIRENHGFANIICDAGTVMTMKVVHAAVSNPTRLGRILPLEPYENTNWGKREYADFFREVVDRLTQEVDDFQLQICGIICDNLPAQVAGLRRFLSSEDGKQTAILHVRCVNHMINLGSGAGPHPEHSRSSRDCGSPLSENQSDPMGISR
jgi:hypothetical protein